MSAKSYVYLNENLDSLKLVKNDVGFIENEMDEFIQVFFLRINKSCKLHQSKIVKFDIKETGDRFDFKVCDRCYKYLDTKTQFENNRHKKGDVITKRPSCRSCRKEKDGKRIPTKQRVEWEKKRPADGSLFTCPICHKTTIVGVSKVVLDHNHFTGNVRGWLCESCNTGIGRFGDQIEIIKHAIEWLEKNNQ